LQVGLEKLFRIFVTVLPVLDKLELTRAQVSLRACREVGQLTKSMRNFQMATHKKKESR